MERKIGEIFEYNGEWYQCVESSGCALCAFNEIDCNDIDTGSCEVSGRSDEKSVVFKKLEKLGEPIRLDGKWAQKVLTPNKYSCDGCCFDKIDECDKPDNGLCCEHEIYVEIKQSKEDMEENNNAKYSNSENIGKNLKPFDLQAAKSGKPVCTRDRRKARIVCFDKITRKNYEEFKIIALVRDKDNEDIHVYNNEGRKYLDDSSVDLMMLPEKK